MIYGNTNAKLKCVCVLSVRFEGYSPQGIFAVWKGKQVGKGTLGNTSSSEMNNIGKAKSQKNLKL